MSMPSFPEIDPDLTHEKALDMILVSIAHEELGLSHIINAEGEKLQYVLDTLSCKTGIHATTEEVLQVNESVTRLLESVLENQIILKNKMAKVLDAFPKPHPPIPPHPPCHPHPSCACRSSLILNAAHQGYCWNSQSKFPWKCDRVIGSGIAFDKSNPAVIWLSPERFYAFDISMQMAGQPDCGDAAAISVQTVRENRLCEVFACHCPAGGEGCGSLQSLSECRIISPDICSCGKYPLMIILTTPKSLTVGQAHLSIIELN